LRSRGAKIKLPPGAGAENENGGSGSIVFTTDLKSWLLILLVKSKKVIFQGILEYLRLRNTVAGTWLGY
jgi:hypothetical protein